MSVPLRWWQNRIELIIDSNPKGESRTRYECHYCSFAACSFRTEVTTLRAITAIQAERDAFSKVTADSVDFCQNHRGGFYVDSMKTIVNGIESECFVGP